MGIKITADDVGRKVLTGNGKIETIIDFNEESNYPVRTKGERGEKYFYKINGLHTWMPAIEDDLQQFLEPKSTDTSNSTLLLIEQVLDMDASSSSKLLLIRTLLKETGQ